MLRFDSRKTFMVEIMDDQNDSWQGIVTRIHDNEKRTFRNSSDLLNIINHCLALHQADTDHMEDLAAPKPKAYTNGNGHTAHTKGNGHNTEDNPARRSTDKIRAKRKES